MRDHLIVIAAHGTANLAPWTPPQPDTLIVRTDMPDDKVLPLGHVATPYCGYDTGAYLWAYWRYPAHRYLFLQDSLIPTISDFADLFWHRDDAVVGWVSFPWGLWDSQEQAQASMFALGGTAPRKGIFGPIFAARRESLDILAERSLLPGIPNHKLAAQAKEREWAMAFAKAEIGVGFVNDFFEPGAMAAGLVPPFAKNWAERT